MRVVDAKIGTRRLDGAAWHSGSAIAPDLPHGDHLVAAHDVETIELGYGETGVVGEDAHSGARWKRMVENSVLLAHGGHAQIRVQPGVRVLIEDMSEMSGGVHSQPASITQWEAPGWLETTLAMTVTAQSRTSHDPRTTCVWSHSA
jgi:hypothetical protein